MSARAEVAEAAGPAARPPGAAGMAGTAAGTAVLSDTVRKVPLEWAQTLAAWHYGLTGRLSVLSGERDSNFLLEADAGHGGPGGTRARRFMLKISHPAESALVADFQTQALLHVAATDPLLPVQRIEPTVDGRASLQATAPDGTARVVRLFSYLDGEPLPKAARSPAQARALARTLARLDLALRELRHPAGELALPWDIQRADEVRALLEHVADPQRRAMALRVLDRFSMRVKPLLPTLRRQPIHNDLNLYNVLVDPADHARIAGILDFGDMVHAPLVNDLAVAAAYQVDPAGDTLGALADFVGAYHEVLPLTADEVAVLFDLLQARLVMVVAISGWRAAREPANAAYLMRNNAISWQRLEACTAIAPGQAASVLARRCELA